MIFGVPHTRWEETRLERAMGENANPAGLLAMSRDAGKQLW
jgi:hypothetical protein